MLGYAPPINITDLPADLDIPAQARMHVLVTLSPSTTGSGTDAYLGPRWLGRLEGGRRQAGHNPSPRLPCAAQHRPGTQYLCGCAAAGFKGSLACRRHPYLPAATETFETTSFHAISIDDSAPHRQWWPALIALLMIAALIAVLIFIL